MLEIKVSDVIIIIIGLTILADTAASPKISAPNMLIEELKLLGNLISLSLSISQIKIIKNVSIVAGKGIPSFCVMKLVRSKAGIVSWLYVIIAI